MAVSKGVIASYVIDWIFILVIAALAGVFTALEPHAHAFSVIDLKISYPLKPDTVPIWVAGVIAGVVPAIIIPIVCLLLVPGRAFSKTRTRGELFRLKLWEWHVGWLGLAMSLAVALMITSGLKNFGKPRPNALDRCQPDVNNIEKYKVGGYGQDISPRWIMVTIDACTQTDHAILKDAFQSWPSGHSTASWAGLLYFTLFLCSKFAVVIPFLPPGLYMARNNIPANGAAAQAAYKRTDPREPIRNRDEAAAPPVYLVFFVLVPLGAALYITLSRWMDYAHHGFDVISGSLIGIVCAYVSFRWYHLPIAQGSGWSWGPRSPGRAFGVGVGRHGYVDEDSTASGEGMDMEMGLMNSRPSHQQDNK